MCIIKDAILTGIGLALNTKEKAEQIFKEALEKKNINKEEGEKFVKELLEKFNLNSSEIKGSEEVVNKYVEELLKKHNIVTDDRVKDLEKKIDRLEELILSLKKEK